MKKERKLKIFKLICLICYIVCAIVLIVESCMDSRNSSSHSSAVGGTIAGIINDFKGDQTVAVSPSSLKIKNKIEEGYVGKTHKLETETLPTEATYKQITFTSSSSHIASIDETGLITFLSPGEVTISAINTKYNDVRDSFTINVKNIEIASVTNSINAEQDENGIYTLYYDVNTEAEDYVPYYINSVISPKDATHQKIEYSIDRNDYISVDENGIITPLKYSANRITTITINIEGYEYKEAETKTLEVIVGLKSIKNAESVTVEKDTYEIYVTQKITPKITVTPKEATFKDYKLLSSSDNVTISGNSIIGKKEGNALITLEMINDQSVKTSFNVKVNLQPNVDNFKVNDSIAIIKGKTSKISISNVIPAYGNISSATYFSSNTSVAEVDNNGKIQAKEVGTSIITTTINGISHITTINVIPQEDDVDKIELATETINPIVIKGQEYKLNELLNTGSISFYKNEVKVTPNQKAFTYTLEDHLLGAIEGNKFTPLSLGEIKIRIEHQSSGAHTDIVLLAIDDFEVSIGEKANIIEQDNNNYSLKVKEDVLIIIDDKESEQEYEVLSSKQESTLISKKDNGTYNILGVSEGNVTITIYPKYLTENNDLINSVKEQYTYSIELDIEHIYSESAEIKVYNNKTNNYLDVESNGRKLSMFINDSITLTAIPDPKATSYSLYFVSSNNRILEIGNDGTLNPHGIGEVDVTLKDRHSLASKTIHVTIYNKILINESQPIIVYGHEATYNESLKRYEITNGYSGKVELCFLQESTYTKVQYQSSNANILEVDQNGILTPHKKGNVTITLVVDDGMIDKKVINIDIRVKPQRVIENMQEFFGKIRKAVGHYGAFLVLGIFSTFTYLLYFTKKKWIWSVPLNFAQGFGLAALTEYIQLFIPGRYGCWSDVVLDTSGFMLSSLIITVAILIRYLVKYLIMKKKKDNQ